MIASCLLLVGFVLSSSPGSRESAGLPDEALLLLAEHSFAQGTSLRNDSSQARPAFARAAIGYDELWRRGYHDPALAINRAHAHELAGDLPRAIAALHEGLDAARWSRPLQAALESARAAVAYPLTGDLASQCRVAAAATISSRMSPREAWIVAGLLWLLMCGSLARFAMTRRKCWLTGTGLATVLLAALGVMWLQDWREREAAEPLVIVSEDVLLRKGNADAFPARLTPRLPRGVEARELSRRGGWVQVRLAGGAIGWLPETAIVRDFR
jgi:hypothetical protein